MSAWPTPNSTFILFLGVYVTTIFATAFAFGVGFDVGMTSFWDRWNQGVRVSVYTLRELNLLTSSAEAVEGYPCKVYGK
jgi:ABC-type uncharacterized transport system permease subunit